MQRQLNASEAPGPVRLADRALIGVGLMAIGSMISILVFTSRGFSPASAGGRRPTTIEKALNTGDTRRASAASVRAGGAKLATSPAAPSPTPSHR